jgi:hypothetical protein
MAVNSSITCNVKGSLIRIAVASMRLNSYVRWSIFTVSTSSTGNWGFDLPIRVLELIHASDLKPENILLDYTGHIALCDFGE